MVLNYPKMVILKKNTKIENTQAYAVLLSKKEVSS